MTCRQRWSFSWKGWLLVCAGGVVLTILLLHSVHPFLAVTERVETDTLVVEGWMDQTDLAQAVAEFHRGGYRRVFTTGGPVHGAGPNANDYSTSAHIAAQQLLRMGLPPDRVQSVPSHMRDRDRTYSAAFALRQWMQDHEESIASVVVVTRGVHSRRSRLLYRAALGPAMKVGVIALPVGDDYDESNWWRYSEGVKEIISEGAAYVYARFLFHPQNT
jgi:hypothetical protein